MRILVCCEGVKDVEPIKILMRKCVPSYEFGVECKTHTELHEITLLKIPKGFKRDNASIKRRGYIKRLSIFASISNINHVGYHQDAGHENYNDVYKDIHDDFNMVPPFSMKKIAIIPKEMTESWLLADVKAINSVGNGTVHVDQSKNPEDLWGDKDNPDSNYPKHYLRRNLEKLDVENNREAYAQIAGNVDVEILKRRCPKSFGQFYSDMQSFITEGAPS
jgi:hypothetical protein